MKVNENIIEIRNMKKFSEENFLHDLGTHSWEHVHFFADNPSTTREIWKDFSLYKSQINMLHFKVRK